jgi:hypothetical protein
LRTGHKDASSSAIGRELRRRRQRAPPPCSAVGVAALRTQWVQAPGDIIAVRILGEVTPRLRDQFLFETVLAVYSDGSRRRPVRLASLESLVGYYQPGLVLRYVEPEFPVQHGSAYVMVGWSDTETSNGTAPLSSDTRSKILAALDQVGKKDRDERLGLISGYIRSRLVALP